MSRPRSDTPREHTSIIRAKRKDGWTYVQRVVSVYDPKIKNSRRISTETLGKLPPGETDLEKLVTLEPRRRKVHFKRLRLPHRPRSDRSQRSRTDRLPIGYCLLRHSSCCDARQNFLHGNCRVLASMPTLAEQDLPQLS